MWLHQGDVSTGGHCSSTRMEKNEMCCSQALRIPPNNFITSYEKFETLFNLFSNRKSFSLFQFHVHARHCHTHYTLPVPSLSISSPLTPSIDRNRKVPLTARPVNLSADGYGGLRTSKDKITNYLHIITNCVST